MLRTRFYLVFCVVFGAFAAVSVAQSNVADAIAEECATGVLRKTYLKHHNRIERTGANDDSLIYVLNRWGKLPSTAPYCGTSIGFFVEKAGLEIVGIAKSQMPLAFNWKKKENIVWDARNGWRDKNRQNPACDEIFILLFRREDGGYHVGVALWFHGGLNLISGQGNTSNWRARQAKKAHINGVGTRLAFREKELLLPPKKYATGKQKGKREQGFFIKETYEQGNLIAIMAYPTHRK